MTRVNGVTGGRGKKTVKLGYDIDKDKRIQQSNSKHLLLISQHPIGFILAYLSKGMGRGGRT